MKLKRKTKLYKLVSLFRYVFIKVLSPGYIQGGLGQIGKNVVFDLNKLSVIEKKMYLADNVEIFSEGELTVGKNLSVNNYTRIMCKEKIDIGNNVVLAQFVSIIDHDHSFDVKEKCFFGYLSGPISIGNNVWISDRVTITKNVKIGDNVIIGANSVVTKDIPSNVIAAGIPARVIKRLI